MEGCRGKNKTKKTKNQRIHSRITQPCGSAAKLEAVVKLFFSKGAARNVSKELQVILKVTMNSFQCLKWIQSFEHGGRCLGTSSKFSCFTLSCVGFFFKKGDAIVSRWRVNVSMMGYKKLPGERTKKATVCRNFPLNLVRWKEWAVVTNQKWVLFGRSVVFHTLPKSYLIDFEK